MLVVGWRPLAPKREAEIDTPTDIAFVPQHGSLTAKLARQILDHVREEGLPPGTRLPERRLAELLGVSRNPIRAALLSLAQGGLLSASKGAGYAVTDATLASDLLAFDGAEQDPEERAYQAIAEDRLSGNLPERISESEMMRRYQLSKAQLARILRRMDSEGWAERRLGHGWQFRPVLTAPETYFESFRLRILLEPAGILEPTFRLNGPALEVCREEQLALVAGRAAEVSAADLFDANVRLHEAIAACSGNTFFFVDRSHAVERCQQHLTLIDLLLRGDRDSASSLMRFHLTVISGEKAR
jgi:DNA-binding GntR family transcriptional regulator